MSIKTVFIILATVLILTEPLLLGSGIFEVGLRNTDTKNDPLVNINELIGGNHMPDPPKPPQPEEDPPKDETTEKPSEEATEREQEKDKTIKIRIEEKSIYINNIIVSSEEFKERFEKLYDESQDVILEDSFAEYHIYDDILSFLNERKILYKEEPVK